MVWMVTERIEAPNFVQIFIRIYKVISEGVHRKGDLWFRLW